MSPPIKRADIWLKTHPKLKQWAWFILLWCGGLLAAMAMAYPIKFLMKQL